MSRDALDLECFESCQKFHPRPRVPVRQHYGQCNYDDHHCHHRGCCSLRVVGNDAVVAFDVARRV